MDYKLVFGLGNRQQVDSVEVQWPDRSRSVYLRPALVACTNSMKPGRKTGISSLVVNNEVLLQPEASVFERPVEDDYVDFMLNGMYPACCRRARVPKRL